MPHDDPRPDPDALLIAAAREHRGRLKIFLGAAPGVGKTWEMLNAARRRHDEGQEVLAGIIETHGRAETQAQITNLEVLPRKQIAYRGQMLEEFDIDAALARHPKLLLVDELAHTNAPGSRHHKRWEDVAELLEAGIDVWATLNIQHLESLNDAVARITGVRVSETLPDQVLQLADEIELVDLTPAELQDRLKDGRIYRPDVARRALGGFFREGNLSALREIALRQAAQHVDAHVTDYMRQNAIQGPWPAGDRVLALVGTDAAAEAVVRQAKRLADALRAPWVALHVERLDRLDDARAALEIASQLGATIEVRAADDLVATVLDLATSLNVTHLVIGRGRPSRWRRLTGHTLAALLLRQADAFSLHVVPMPGPQGLVPRSNRLRGLRRDYLPWVAASTVVAGIVGVGRMLTGWLEHEAMGMLFLAGVVGVASRWGLAVALFTAVLGFLAWNFFFIPPIYSITIQEPRDVVAIFVFAGVAAVTGWLASRVRNEARAAQRRIETLRRIVAFSRTLGAPADEPELLEEVVRQAAELADTAVVLTVVGEDLNIRAAMPREVDTIDEGGWAAARWCYTRQEPAGAGTATLPGSAWRFLPLRTVRGLLAVLGVRPLAPLDPANLQALQALADQAAAALERVRLATEAARSVAQSETQKLRTALLNSLSHDLRTPLTCIRGAAGTLRSAWDSLTPVTREDLLASIEQDTVRMTRFLANITEMTRLESGEVAPRMGRVVVAEQVESAIARVPGIGLVSVDLPPGLPPVQADPALLEQVLVNVLENAVKYAPPDAPIRVRASSRGGTLGLASGEVVISIADEGVGIPEADLPHVFDSFYRARREDRTVPGTGLGLAIAQGLVNAMGGNIAAFSPRPDAPRDGAPGTVIEIHLKAAP
jgi:two-component system sensor histidine kinase KdpD